MTIIIIYLLRHKGSTW